MITSPAYKFAIAGAAVLLVSTVAGESRATATQGTLGSTSQGTVNINVTKSEEAQISGLTDLTLANWSLNDPAPSLTENICVYSTRPSGGYTINATGNGTSNAFTLAGGSAPLPYSVQWFDGGSANPAGGTAVALTAGTTSAKMVNASTTSVNCGGGSTAALAVNFATSDMQAAADGNYTGTLTLLVTPD